MSVIMPTSNPSFSLVFETSPPLATVFSPLSSVFTPAILPPSTVFAGFSANSTSLAATTLIGQANFNQDVLGDISKGVSHFIESGQVWACLAGLVAGYMLKSITSSH